MPTTSQAQQEAKGARVTIKSQADDLYGRCMTSRKLGHAFTLAELVSLSPTNDEQAVLELTDRLIDDALFILCRSNDGHNEASWKLRDKKQAEIVRKFEPTERVVYERIADAQREGAWLGNLRSRTGIHENLIRKIVKDFKARGLVKEMKSVKAGQRKLLILKELEPSEASSGGPFYQDAELDEGLVQSVSYAVCKFVEEKSWEEDRKVRDETLESRRQRNGEFETNHVAQQKKRKREISQAAGRFDSQDATDKNKRIRTDARESKRSSNRYEVFTASPAYVQPFSNARLPLVPLASRSQSFPTNADIAKHLETFAKVAFQHVDITPTHLEALLDMLVFDDRLERLPDNTYRAVRRSFQKFSDHTKAEAGSFDQLYNTGASGAPCGRCPVSDICEVGGPVSPEKCEYYRMWLER